MRKRSSSVAGRFWPLLAALLMIACVAGSCGSQENGAGFKAPSSEDLSSLSWAEAFKGMHEKLSREYAFTEWRGIDWDGLYAAFLPLIEAAEGSGSREDYYIALRRYLGSLGDGHVTIAGDDLGLMDSLYGGGFGLTLERLDDSRVIANWVKEDGPAHLAGIRAGAEMVSWDGRPIEAALEETDTSFSLYQPATQEMRGCMQRFFLTRAPAGKIVPVDFLNPGEAAASAVLTAVEDGMETLEHSYSLVGFPPPENRDGVTRMVVAETLPGGFGYLRIEGEYDLPPGLQGDRTPTMKLYESALDGFIESGAPGLIIDVRSNDGGSDQMVADMMSRLYADSSFYEYQNWYDSETGEMEIILVDEESGAFRDPGAGITIRPGPAAFNGPVIALVNPACISSGEGIAMCVGRLGAGEVVGFRGTNGSFGMVYGPLIRMPGGYSITYPTGQSLDEGKAVQVESRNGLGGVTPSRKVPLDAESAIRAGAGEDVELEFALRLLQGMTGQQPRP